MFRYKYDNKLILELIESTKFGTIASNILASFLSAILLYDKVPNYYLFIFLAINLFIFVSRLFTAKELKNSIHANNNLTIRYIQIYTILMSLSAISFSVILFCSMLYSINDLEIFAIASIIIALSAGSIATLGSVYIVFATFMISNIIPLIIVMTIHGGKIFYIISGALSLYLVVHLIHGFRLFLYHKKAIDLEKKFSTIYNKSSNGIAILKEDKILECNDTFITMFNYQSNKQNLYNSSILTIIPPSDQITNSPQEIIRHLNNAKKQQISFEWLTTKQNGKDFYIEIIMSPIELNDQMVIHTIFRDIDLRKQAEIEIIRLNATLEERVSLEVEKNRLKDKHMLQQSRLAQMGEMISMIAHQWRQPLSAISTVAISINLKAQLNKLDNNTAIEATNKISEYTRYLSETIDDFRKFFKSNKTKQDTNYTELISSVLKIVEVSIQNQGIEIVQNLNSQTVFKTYTNELKQVILNLIKNSEDVLIERDIKNPKIYIESYDTTLIIRDNAGGIPTDIIDKIFEPYFSTKLEKTGTGLGLYMSKTIIEEHCRGKLIASNDNHGAVFKVII